MAYIRGQSLTALPEGVEHQATLPFHRGHTHDVQKLNLNSENFFRGDSRLAQTTLTRTAPVDAAVQHPLSRTLRAGEGCRALPHRSALRVRVAPPERMEENASDASDVSVKTGQSSLIPLQSQGNSAPAPPRGSGRDASGMREDASDVSGPAAARGGERAPGTRRNLDLSVPDSGGGRCGAVYHGGPTASPSRAPDGAVERVRGPRTRSDPGLSPAPPCAR